MTTITKDTFKRFKELLLGLPGWNHGSTRKAFLQDLFWRHSILDELNHEVPGGRAANDLIEQFEAYQATDVDGLTPACALLKAIREKYGAGPDRQRQLAALESALCGSPIRSALFLAANPEDEDLDQLRTNREYKKIANALRGSPITLHLPALDLHSDELAGALHRTQPGLVHFSGHGGGEEGIFFEDAEGNAKPIEAEALSALFRGFSDTVKVVVLNACLSDVQAEAIVQHIDFVIGTVEEVGDDTAIAFSHGFYQALAAGRPVDEAFQLGCAEIRLEGIPEHQIPVLMTRDGKVISCA